MIKLRTRHLLIAVCATLAACTPRPAEPVAVLPADAPVLAHRGEQIYRSICISCHNPDPRKPGAVGPALAGSSALLLEARLLRSTYPPGYKPKRETHQMPVYPQLATEVPALAAYLQAFSAATPSPAANQGTQQVTK